MSFDELWAEVKGLPGMAILDIPSVLSQRTKLELTKKAPAEVGKIISEVIDEVNNGSIEKLDSLIQRRL